MNVLRLAVAAMVLAVAACGSKSDDGAAPAAPPPPATVALSVTTVPFVIEPGAEVLNARTEAVTAQVEIKLHALES